MLDGEIKNLGCVSAGQVVSLRRSQSHYQHAKRADSPRVQSKQHTLLIYLSTLFVWKNFAWIFEVVSPAFKPAWWWMDGVYDCFWRSESAVGVTHILKTPAPTPASCASQEMHYRVSPMDSRVAGISIYWYPLDPGSSARKCIHLKFRYIYISDIWYMIYVYMYI